MIALTPVGSALLIADAIVRYGWTALSSLGGFAMAIYVGLALVVSLVYPLLLILNRLSPARFFPTAWPAIQLGFLSRSSVGTLPVTEEATETLYGEHDCDASCQQSRSSTSTSLRLRPRRPASR